MTQPDPNKEITLTIGDLDALIKAAGMFAVLEHVQQQIKAAEVRNKIQSQLAEKTDGA